MPPTPPAASGAPARRAGRFTDLVRQIVSAVPEGRATTYGLINETIGVHTGVPGSALAVGRAMSRSGGTLPWWRVVRADGTIDHRLAPDAHPRWRAEGLPLRHLGDELAIDLNACLWDAPIDWSPDAPDAPDRAADA